MEDAGVGSSTSWFVLGVATLLALRLICFNCSVSFAAAGDSEDVVCLQVGLGAHIQSELSSHGSTPDPTTELLT